MPAKDDLADLDQSVLDAEQAVQDDDSDIVQAVVEENPEEYKPEEGDEDKPQENDPMHAGTGKKYIENL